jgi:hypothetical protein
MQAGMGKIYTKLFPISGHIRALFVEDGKAHMSLFLHIVEIIVIIQFAVGKN